MNIPNEVRHTIDEINGIETELTAIGKRTKIMRKRREELLENLSKFLETTRSKSINYRGKEYSVEKQNKLIKKTK
jgi:hypothetical protein